MKLVAQGVKDSTFCEAVGVGTGEGVFVALAVGLATLVLVSARGTIDWGGASERAVRSRGTR